MTLANRLSLAPLPATAYLLTGIALREIRETAVLPELLFSPTPFVRFPK